MGMLCSRTKIGSYDKRNVVTGTQLQPHTCCGDLLLHNIIEVGVVKTNSL